MTTVVFFALVLVALAGLAGVTLLNATWRTAVGSWLLSVVLTWGGITLANVLVVFALVAILT